MVVTSDAITCSWIDQNLDSLHVVGSTFGISSSKPLASETVIHVILKTLEYLKKEIEVVRIRLDRQGPTNNQIQNMLSTILYILPPQPWNLVLQFLCDSIYVVILSTQFTNFFFIFFFTNDKGEKNNDFDSFYSVDNIPSIFTPKSVLTIKFWISQG